MENGGDREKQVQWLQWDSNQVKSNSQVKTQSQPHTLNFLRDFSISTKIDQTNHHTQSFSLRISSESFYGDTSSSHPLSSTRLVPYLSLYNNESATCKSTIKTYTHTNIQSYKHKNTTSSETYKYAQCTHIYKYMHKNTNIFAQIQSPPPPHPHPQSPPPPTLTLSLSAMLVCLARIASLSTNDTTA